MTAGEYQDLWYALGVGYVTVRQSIGDLAPPNPIVWDDFGQVVSNPKFEVELKDGSNPTLIIHAIWFIWVFQTIIMVVVLLNILISVIA